jgi:hypothetical protein
LEEGTDTWDLRDPPAVDDTFRLKLQHRLVLELLVEFFTGSKTDTMENVFGQRTPTATSIHHCNLADHQHEVTEPVLFGAQQADLLSGGGPCEGFRDALEDDRA